jgi:precorrin-6Y C5,15-methyltransferase (decarboxylating)
MNAGDPTIINVAGISGSSIPVEIRELIREQSAAIVCSSALFDLLKDSDLAINTEQWISITPIDTCMHLIEDALARGNVLVLTSGDPLFYGFGRTLLQHFPASRLLFLPAASSMQLCFSRFAIPWDDAVSISLHGRSISVLDMNLHKKKLFILTDKNNSPQKIACHFLSIVGREEIKNYVMHVGIRLGMPHEQLVSGSVEEIAAMSFEQPNCLIVLNQSTKNRTYQFRFGLNEFQICHSRGLITKNEVRAAVLHGLELPDHGVFWDIGAGSGSIGLEAARMNPALSVYAIEKEQSELHNIINNRDTNHCWNLAVVAGEAPEILAKLPVPDRVFIGGSGGKLRDIILYIDEILPPHGLVLMTGVISSTYETAPKLFHDLGYTVDVSIVETSRYRYSENEVQRFNPIHIIKATQNNAR